MSNIWISAKTVYTPGPQANTVVESQKLQASSIAVTVLNYALHAITDSESESQKLQASIAITVLNYA
jgi:hypothetical protein